MTTKTKKYLQRIDDGFVISYHEALADSKEFRVIEVPEGENPQPDGFLSPADIEARDAKPVKAAK